MEFNVISIILSHKIYENSLSYLKYSTQVITYAHKLSIREVGTRGLLSSKQAYK